jgi:hypothetical protein
LSLCGHGVVPSVAARLGGSLTVEKPARFPSVGAPMYVLSAGAARRRCAALLTHAVARRLHYAPLGQKIISRLCERLPVDTSWRRPDSCVLKSRGHDISPPGDENSASGTYRRSDVSRANFGGLQEPGLPIFGRRYPGHDPPQCAWPWPDWRNRIGSAIGFFTQRQWAAV